MDDHDLNQLTHAQLRTLAKEHQIPVTGNKTTLVGRLTKAGVTAPAQEADADTDADDVFTSDDPALRTAVPGEVLPDADPDGYGPDSTPLPAPSQETTEDGNGDGLRQGLIELLELDDSDELTDQLLLDFTATRIAAASTPAFTDDTEDTLSAYRRGRSEAIDQAVKEIIATTGRAGGTLVKRVKRVADRVQA